MSTNVVGLALVSLVLAGCATQSQRSGSRTVGISRTIRIPVFLAPSDAPPGRPPSPGVLTIAEGGTDELPDGPHGFDVLDDGGLLITDPLQKRIAIYDPRGAYRSEWPIGFAADSITLAGPDSVEIREASTQEVRLFDRNGNPRPGAPIREIDQAQARLLGPTRGVIDRPRTRGGAGGPLEVRFESSGRSLISLVPLSGDTPGYSYVALESTGGGENLEISKDVRKYAADGSLAAQITGIPLDYFVHPVDELRVHKGLVYQLMPARAEVRINVWDTN